MSEKTIADDTGLSVEEVEKILAEKAVEPIEPSPEKVFEALDTVEIRVGTVTEASVVPKSELLKMTVDFGSIGIRTILGRISKYIQADQVSGKQFAFVTNLPPRQMKGIDSEGMILAAKDDTGLALLNTTVPVANGTRLG